MAETEQFLRGEKSKTPNRLCLIFSFFWFFFFLCPVSAQQLMEAKAVVWFTHRDAPSRRKERGSRAIPGGGEQTTSPMMGCY
ncbi:hypothetical protein EUGRSUZ_G00716 [Eucalyptus grandis]|uniref:Uncharacterized protein n=2 Tax=Eucalyptus grandis TaxID=71139 RepID=A0ACC3K149_EUCGR|nr:hypothetical protein EUGRSUZ_G00716 [Eucalyptus grandis]